MTTLTIPDFSLVVLIGASGSGKSTFAKRHFLPTEIVSSDFFRGLVSDDENDQKATVDAFEALHFIAAKRLARMKLTVVDATNVQSDARKPLLKLARDYHALPVAIVLDLPEKVCIERNRQRADRNFGVQVIARQHESLRRSLRGLEREGFRRLFVLKSEEEIAEVVLQREPLWTNRTTEHGPFDIIGDVHGCYDELILLLGKLGYQTDGTIVTPPDGRKAIFLGDLVDRGPKSPQVLKLVMQMVAVGTALCIPGNHDNKLLRKLRGRDVQVTHGLAKTLEQLDDETPEFRRDVVAFLDSLISHFVLDDGKLVVAHAGMKESMAGRASGAIRDFALYGDTTGETDEFGLPVRLNWAADYRGTAKVVYGHTPIPEPQWLNNTLNIDTGCVFGGSLTALRYPERELVSVAALETYAESARPFLPTEISNNELTAQQQGDDVLDISDVLVLDKGMGKRFIETRLQKGIQIRAENASAALEVMSRFAVDPRWLVYLPPTMSPVETSKRPDLLEHPNEAFTYYRNGGITEVICEEKHMGSRAVVVICQDEEATMQRFGMREAGIGVIYTRTGRRFFNDVVLETAVLTRLRDAITHAGLWEELNTTWMVLDCELMPWSAKAQELLQTQYAAIGTAAHYALQETLAVMNFAATNGADIMPLLENTEQRTVMVDQYIGAYRRYCWEVNGVDDLRLAPFHLLANEEAVHTDKTHRWHIDTLAKLQRNEDKLFYPTAVKMVDLMDESSVTDAVQWWEQLTASGGEGMVVKPLRFVAMGKRRVLQPAIKVRGREYLRIIYGAEYTSPAQLEQLRSRGLSTKRNLALREFALGVESLERFVRREPLRRVHECVFGILALESEPVDPRL